VTGGAIAEFVNPKYKNAERTEFKAPTRLECMMQDYPKSLGKHARVGFTTLEVWAAYSPVKNSPEEGRDKAKSGSPSHTATSGELDVYAANCRLLQVRGLCPCRERERERERERGGGLAHAGGWWWWWCRWRGPRWRPPHA
jgi:hypothetical protein